MPRINPLQLLKCLSILLGPDGGIKSEDEVARLAGLMRKFSKKLVSKCIYIEILKNTQPSLLDLFMSAGGWALVNTWLLDANSTNNWAWLKVILELLDKCVVSIERLKENNTAKMVKNLSRDASDNSIQRLALALVKKWMGIVKGNEMRLQNHNEKLSGEDEGESEEDKERSKRRKESKKDLRGKDKNSSSRKSDQGSSVESKKKRKNTEDVEVKKMKKRTPDMASVQNLNSKNSSKPSSDGMSNSDFSDVKLDVDDDFLSKITKSKSERPKTVKTFNSKFRSTGLLEEPSKQPVTLKNSKKKEASLQRLSPAMKKEEFSQPIAPPSVSPPSSEKESNSQTASSDDQQDKVKEKHKSSSSKRKVAKILESATFMEALEAAGTSLPKKRRRKLSSSAETPPPTVTKPSFKFYQDTLEKDNGEETEKTSDAMEEEELPETDTSCIAESKDHEEEEMDQEEEEEEEEVEELKVKVKEENHLEEDQTAAEGPKDEPGGENHSVATDRKVDLVKSEQGDRLFKLKSVLASAGGSSEKVKKKVSWAEEASLKEVFIFEMDETERVNVNRMKTFGDLMQRERDNEKKAFMKARKQAMGDTMEEQIVWGQLRPLDCPAPPAPPGSKSAEKGVQRARELSVPPATYFQLIQDSPSEPDREYQETKDPRIIPLEDSTAEEKDFTNHPWPAQKGFAPKPAQQSRAIPKGGEWRTSDGRPVAVGDFPPAPQPPPMALGGMMVPPGMMPPPMAGGYPPMMFPGPPGHTLASPMMAMMGQRGLPPGPGPCGPMPPRHMGLLPRMGFQGPPSQNNREREDVCRFFMKTGDCRFGDRCKFLHLVPH